MARPKTSAGELGREVIEGWNEAMPAPATAAARTQSQSGGHSNHDGAGELSLSALRSPTAPTPASSITSPAAELALLRRENEALRVMLRSLRPEHVAISSDAYTVLNHTVKRVKLTRSMSMGTAAILDAAPTSRRSDLVENMVTLFGHRHGSEEYVKTSSFASDLIRLCRQAAKQFSTEDRLLQLASPCYIFGDIHGNMPDLHFFSENLWSFGVELTAGNFLFLGDYVDRGQQGLEVVAYLFALKLMCPQKVWLLRGNHELRKVNGWEDWYKSGSFVAQCKARFGEELGLKVWNEVNAAFDCLPLAAVVDDKIFCSHGGIPRPLTPETAAAVSASLAATQEFDDTEELEIVGSAGAGTGASAASALSGSSARSTPRRRGRRGDGAPHTPVSNPRFDGDGSGVTPASTLGSSFVSAAGSPGYRTPAAARAAASKRHRDGRLDAIRAVPCPCPLVSPGFSSAQESTEVQDGRSGKLGDGVAPGLPEGPREAVNRVALDMLWADPATNEMEDEYTGGLREDGFGPGLRGGDTVCYGTRAIDAFLEGNDLDLIVRAHQATAAGIGLCKNARVITVFSTSKDHGCGDGATCGCLLVEGGRVLPITRSPSYRPPRAHSSSSGGHGHAHHSSRGSPSRSRRSGAQRRLDVDGSHGAERPPRSRHVV